MTSFDPNQNREPTNEEITDAAAKGDVAGVFMVNKIEVCQEDGTVTQEINTKIAGPIINSEYGGICLPVLSDSQIQAMNIESPEDVLRALKGDSGEINRGVASKGYTKKYADNFDKIFKNSNN